MNGDDGNRRRFGQCSLRRGMEIVPGRLADWERLAEFHYRSGRLGAVDKVFVIRREAQRHKGTEAQRENGAIQETGGRRQGRNLTTGYWLLNTGSCNVPVGVIVYGMPVPCVALRNRATGDRYVGLGGRTAMLQLINKELRCVSRIVIHPQYRGIGLAHWLVRETLERAGTPLVEAMAVMGKVNPFFEKAGMTRYEAVPSPPAVRMLAAFEQVGLEPEQLYDTAGTCAIIRQAGEMAERFIVSEMRKFERHRSTKAQRHKETGLEDMVATTVRQALSRPVYYLWRRKEW